MWQTKSRKRLVHTYHEHKQGESLQGERRRRWRQLQPRRDPAAPRPTATAPSQARPSPGANAAATSASGSGGNGSRIGSEAGPGEREVATAIESSACSHAHSYYTGTEFLGPGGGVGTHKRVKDFVFGEFLAGFGWRAAAVGWVCAPAARLVCAWGLGADGDGRRAMICSVLPLP